MIFFLLRFVSFHLSCKTYLNIVLLNCSKKHSMNRPGFAMNILPQRSRLLRNPVSTSFYIPSYPFYFPSEFILPRMCFNGANPGNYLVQQREAPIWDCCCAPAKCSTQRGQRCEIRHQKKRHLTPMRACQPIKYTRKTIVPGMTRVRSKMLPRININVCPSSRWTSFESRSITRPVVNLSRSALLSCRIRQN